jgi:hypothetical protein
LLDLTTRSNSVLKLFAATDSMGQKTMLLPSSNTKLSAGGI